MRLCRESPLTMSKAPLGWASGQLLEPPVTAKMARVPTDDSEAPVPVALCSKLGLAQTNPEYSQNMRNETPTE